MDNETQKIAITNNNLERGALELRNRAISFSECFKSAHTINCVCESCQIIRAWETDRSELISLSNRLEESQTNAKKYLHWANCGGCPTGRLCTADPKDRHEIYGPGMGDSPENYVCELHFYRTQITQLYDKLKRGESGREKTK